MAAGTEEALEKGMTAKKQLPEAEAVADVVVVAAPPQKGDAEAVAVAAVSRFREVR